MSGVAYAAVFAFEALLFVAAAALAVNVGAGSRRTTSSTAGDAFAARMEPR